MPFISAFNGSFYIRLLESATDTATGTANYSVANIDHETEYEQLYSLGYESQMPTPFNVTFSGDGNYMYTSGNDLLIQYGPLASPYDITTSMSSTTAITWGLQGSGWDNMTNIGFIEPYLDTISSYQNYSGGHGFYAPHYVHPNTINLTDAMQHFPRYHQQTTPGAFSTQSTNNSQTIAYHFDDLDLVLPSDVDARDIRGDMKWLGNQGAYFALFSKSHGSAKGAQLAVWSQPNDAYSADYFYSYGATAQGNKHVATGWSDNFVGGKDLAVLINNYHSSTDTDFSDFEMNDAGTKIWLLSRGTRWLYELTLSTPYDPTTATYDGTRFAVTMINIPTSLHWVESTERLFIGGDGLKVSGSYTSNNGIIEYSLTAPPAPATTVVVANFSNPTLSYTLDNPNAYNTAANDNFGDVVAINDTYAAIGVPLEDDASGTSSGKVYVFNLSDGSLTYTLDNPSQYGTGASDYFGHSIAMSDTHIIVGAPYEDRAGTQSGTIYIFDLSDGSLTYSIFNPDPVGEGTGDYFGWSVGISGNYAIAGAPYYDETGTITQSGRVYIFNMSTGLLEYTLNNPNAYSTAASDFFGISVAISDTRAIVGAQSEDNAVANDVGKAYIFDMSDGSLEYTLDNPTNTALSRFGQNVAITDDYAVVTAPREESTTGQQTSGRAYIYNLSDGSLRHTLYNPEDPTGDEHFGQSLDVSNTHVIVGAHRSDRSGGSQSGAAYIFDISDGSLESTLDNPNAYDTILNDEFGISVAIYGANAIVGAHQEDEQFDSNSGKAYIFQGYLPAEEATINWEYATQQGLLAPTADASYAPYGAYGAGSSVDISDNGNIVIVGAPQTSTSGGSSVGSAYIFSRDEEGVWSQDYEFENPDPTPFIFSPYQAGDAFGGSVAISGDGNTAIVGSRKQENGSNARVGAAHVYIKSGSTWTAQTILQPSNLVENDDFSSSVVLSQDGNTAVVAAVYKDASGSTDTVGAVYVFTRSGSTWSQEAQLAPTDLAVMDLFGDSIAISDDGNILVAGSSSEDPSGTSDAGSAYVFTRSGSTWTEQQKIQASDATASDSFGWRAAMSGDGSTIAIGARYHDPGGLTSGGAVYVFTESGGTWTEQQKILSDEIAAQDAFSMPSLSEDGNTLIVSAFGANSSITNAGAAYVFTRSGSTWTQVKKLTARDSQSGDNFGWSLALSNDGTTAIVGANESSNGPGMAYIFDSTAEQFIPVYTTVALSSFSGSLPGTFYPHGVSFNNDGTKAYLDDMEISGSSSISIAEYSLSTPYDLASATYTTRKLVSYPNLSDTGSTAWNNDGSKIYVGLEMQSGQTTRPRIIEFDVSTPFDISTMSTTPNTYISSTNYTKSLTWNEDGTKLFAAIDSTGILTVTCSTPYSLSGATTAFTQLFDASTFDVEGRAWGVAFRNNGTEMFILQSQVTDDSIWKFSLGTAYDFTTATLIDTLTTTDYGIDYPYSLTYADGKLIIHGSADVGGSNVNAYTYLDSTIIGAESVPTLWYGDRALATGNNGIPWNTIEYFDITTTTNAAIFGNMQAYEDNRGSVSDTSRAAIAGRSRYDSVGTGGIEYLTIATPGNAQDFGNLVTGGRERTAGASDGTTGLFAGGSGIGATHPFYHIDYITIATTGNAQNFGNLIKPRNELHAGMGDSTYGLFAGGHEYNVGETNSIDYVNISTPSNASTWGTLTASKGAVSGLANGTYGLIGGGYTQSPANTRHDTIDYVTIATQGNAASFGVLSVGRTTPGATNNATRGVFLAGQALSGKLQTTEYVTIATPGNAASLLQLTQPLSSLGATSGNP